MTTTDQLRTDLAQVVRDMRCTHVALTPTVSRLLLEAFPDPPDAESELSKWREKTGLRLWHHSTGSEPVPRWMATEWLKRGVNVVNVGRRTSQSDTHTCLRRGQDYGPSETTVGVVSQRVDREDLEWLQSGPSSYLPIGTPNGSNRIYLFVPDTTEEVKEDEEGEICIGGPQVSLRGYVDPTLNDAAFVHHPNYGRIYRTGDLGRYFPRPDKTRVLH